MRRHTLWWSGPAVTAAMAAVATGVGQLVDRNAAPLQTLTFTAAIAVSFAPMAALILHGVPGHLVGRLMAATAACAGLEVLAASWSGWLPLAWLSQWAWWPSLGLIILALAVFPDGRLPSRAWLPLAGMIMTGTVVAAVALAVAAIDEPRSLLTSVAAAQSDRAAALIVVARWAVALTIACLAGVAVLLWTRWRRADGETRQQLACLMPAAMLLILGLVLVALGLPAAWLATAVVVPVAMTVAVLRFRLYQLDVLVNRAVVWLLLTLLVIAGFVAIVALLRRAFVSLDSSSAPLVATGLIVVTFEPLHQRIQRSVNRLLYGERDEPYKVIADLGNLLERTADPNAVLPLLTQTIAVSLRVPYVAVRASGPAGSLLLAEHGAPTTTMEAFDMVTHGECVGMLLVARRSPNTDFTSRECRLLGNVAVHAAVAAEATRLIRDLQVSRERLVMAGEEERRRLRRDLHDGLGPSLAGMSMQVQAARKILFGQRAAGTLLDALAADLRSCTIEVRRVVDQLRPPALDSGLEAALRAECLRFTTPMLSVHIRFDGDLDRLPAAVEMAAFRIVAESLTNVTRHARANTCRVHVARGHSLTMRVVDNGIGLPSTRRAGVGLTSMRERAAELGGDCEIIGTSDGTTVEVRIPLPPPVPQQATEIVKQDW